MRGKKVWLYLLMGVLVASFLVPRSQKDVQAARGSVFTAHVKSVVDGDTIHLEEDILGSHKVRFLNIDTPETKFFGHAQEPWGSDATKFLLTLIQPGDEITIITDEVEKDQYGRLLAHVMRGKLDINRELLKEGYATMYYIYPNMKYFRSYQAAVIQAMKAKKGIWNPKNPLTEEPFEFRNRIRTGTKGTSKFVGNFNTKEYVSPDDYSQIPTQNRVFFWSKKEAEEAGYTQLGKDELAS